MKLSQNIILSSVFAEGLSTFVVGLSVVFLALLALVIILTLSGKFFEKLDESKKLEAERVAKAKEKSMPVPKQKPEAEPEDDLELIAVITASVAASMGTDADSLRVRSIRKTDNVWNMTGRKEQLYN